METLEDLLNATPAQQRAERKRRGWSAPKRRPSRWLAVAVLTAGGVICLLLALMPTPSSPDYFPAQTVPYTGGADTQPAPYITDTTEETTSHA